MQSEEEVKPDSDFSGNYIEKFDESNKEEFFPKKVSSWDKINDSFIFKTETTSLELTIISADIIKFRYGNEGYFDDDFSYAITPDLNFKSPKYKITEKKSYFVVKTDSVKCYVSKDNLSTRITDLKGTTIVEDEKGYHWRDHKFYGGEISICTKVLHDGEKFYGLGDKTGRLNMIKTRKELWGSDCYGYGDDSDPVYKNIPFYMGQHSRIGYGIFMDSTYRTFFDFGKERDNACSFWTQGGEMRYYYIHGPKLMDVVQKYASLTGTAPMPPKWALGYHQSKWSYYPESVVKNLANEFRTRKIPCDVIHLDIDYMDGFRCFTWDKNRFPDPAKMMAELKDQGFKSIVIIDPGIKVDKNYWVYQEGREGDHFCKRMDGDLLKASVWPGLCHFPDFTKKDTREWWSTLYKGLIEDGVDGVWNDMNEPATFEEGTFPNDVRFDYDGHPCSHRKAHNVYGSLMAQATAEGQEMFHQNKRQFTISRSAYAGIQRHSSVWTGDNSASWDHLKIANIQCQRLSASGISFVGSDVGGFIGSPSGELFTRWIQMAVFHPFFRTHSSGDHGNKEPWVFDEIYTNIIREFIELRYKILPYIYTAFWQHHNTGYPILRSLHLESHDDPESFFREEEFFLGDHILVCPMSKEGAVKRLVYLPKGYWFNYWTDEIVEGKNEVSVNATINEIPFFVRSGAVLPHQPAMQYVGEFDYDALTLHFYLPVTSTESFLYEDAGDGLQHMEGEYVAKTFVSEIEMKDWRIVQSSEGEFETCYHSYDAIFHGLKGMPSSIIVDGEEKISQAKFEGDKLLLTLSTSFESILIH